MISAVILTKNEEKNILECLHSLRWCDEIIVIDDYSEDKTIDLINKWKTKEVKVYKHHLANNFSAQRNYGLTKASGNWVLFVDADERVTSSLQYEILSLINASVENINGYLIKRKDIIWGKELKHGETNKIKILRLAKRTSGEWKGNVHEVWCINGKTAILKNPLIHYPHRTLNDFLKEVNYYTDIRAKELYQQRRKVKFWSIIFFPSAKFIQNYIFRLGFLDGMRGLIIAVLMSFHSFLVRGKLWSLWRKKLG